jgi:hypothetical protein
MVCFPLSGSSGVINTASPTTTSLSTSSAAVIEVTSFGNLIYILRGDSSLQTTTVTLAAVSSLGVIVGTEKSGNCVIGKMGECDYYLTSILTSIHIYSHLFTSIHTFHVSCLTTLAKRPDGSASIRKGWLTISSDRTKAYIGCQNGILHFSLNGDGSVGAGSTFAFTSQQCKC